MQSELGIVLMNHYEMDTNNPTSWLYLKDEGACVPLDAVIRVGCRWERVWKALLILRVIPQALRGMLHRMVATNRNHWFGAADLCETPDPNVQEKLLT